MGGFSRRCPKWHSDQPGGALGAAVALNPYAAAESGSAAGDVPNCYM